MNSRFLLINHSVDIPVKNLKKTIMKKYMIPTSFTDKLWLYSRFYAKLFLSINNLVDTNEYYSALLMQFNAFELIIKSVRENYNENLSEDIAFLYNNQIISEEENRLLNDGKFCVRNIRNMMCHRNAYMYIIEINNVAYPMINDETWEILYDYFTPIIISVIAKTIEYAQL